MAARTETMMRPMIMKARPWPLPKNEANRCLAMLSETPTGGFSVFSDFAHSLTLGSRYA